MSRLTGVEKNTNSDRAYRVIAYEYILGTGTPVSTY